MSRPAVRLLKLAIMRFNVRSYAGAAVIGLPGFSIQRKRAWVTWQIFDSYAQHMRRASFLLCLLPAAPYRDPICCERC